MKKEITLSGYGYFSSVEALLEAIGERRKKNLPLAGGALVFEGAEIVKSPDGSVFLKGESKRDLAVRILPTGDLDVRPREDSWDNE